MPVQYGTYYVCYDTVLNRYNFRTTIITYVHLFFSKKICSFELNWIFALIIDPRSKTCFIVKDGGD
jgi:hypothetical protein